MRFNDVDCEADDTRRWEKYLKFSRNEYTDPWITTRVNKIVLGIEMETTDRKTKYLLELGIQYKTL